VSVACIAAISAVPNRTFFPMLFAWLTSAWKIDPWTSAPKASSVYL